jgi:hypothetical protein
MLVNGMALAQNFPGAKPDPAGASTLGSSGAGLGPFVNILLALGIVYGLLRFALPKVVSRMNKRMVTTAGSSIRIEETAAFAGGSLYLVSAKGKSLLLSVSTQGVSCLADLTEPQAAEPLPPSFGEMVEQELRRTEAEPLAEPGSAENRWTEALQRLERLAR